MTTIRFIMGSTLLSTALYAAPANDDFTNAAVIAGFSGFSETINSSNAAAEVEEPEHGGGGEGPYHSVWWQYTPDTNGVLSLDTWLSDTNLDTELAVYTGSA